MKRMSQNFPTGGAMDTHFANMRSLIQVTWHMTFLPLPAWVSAVICLFFWSHLWHHEFWTLRVFFSDPWLRVVWAHASEWRLHPFLLLLPLVSPGLQKRWGLFQTLKVSLCVIKHSEDAASQIVPSLLNFLCVVCLCQSYSTRMCLQYGRSSGSPLASPPSTLSCSLHLLWWRCTGILSWTTTWTSLISSSSLMVSQLNRGHL